MDIQSQIITILMSDFGLTVQSIEDQNGLFSANHLDSLTSLHLITKLEQDFDISISPLDVSIDDINTVDRMVALVEKNRQA